jgi:hypothetical protein
MATRKTGLISLVGRREMIGAAATAQVAILPTWMGFILLLGTGTQCGRDCYRFADDLPIIPIKVSAVNPIKSNISSRPVIGINKH